MPNKFITNLDLSRQAEIFSGETAVFKGGMQLGIPFSGFPTGVDTSTITSLGVVDNQFAVFSGSTGTTVFNITDPTSSYYSAITGTIVYSSPYIVIDTNSITESVPITSYPTLMSFTAATGVSAEPITAVFASPVVQEIYDRELYDTLFYNLGIVSTGATFIDESFYNVGSVFSGANFNMEVVTLGTHASTPAWSTGTTSGTVIEYSAMTQYWTDPTIISYTSGLTLPITPESADTQTSDYVWTLTSSEIIDENLIGLQYTGYSITYSFNDVVIDPSSPSITGGTSADTYYYGSVVATFENFSAGTLDYKGSTNWMKIDGMSTVEERLTVGRMTINNPDTGSSVSTLGIDVDGKVVKYTAATSTAVTGLTFNDTTYDLTLGIDDGTTFTDSLAILASDIKVTGGTFNDTSGEMTFVNNSGGTFVVSGLSTDFTGNTSGTCITDLHISNLHSCSPLYINPLDEGNVYFGSTSGVTIDVANNRIGIGTETPSSQLHIAGSGANTIIRVQSEDQNNAVINLDTQTTGGAGPRNSLFQFQQNSITKWMIGMNGLAGGTEEDNQLVIANGTDFDTDNILNINPSNGYVGLGVQAPTERLDINGNIKISGGLNLSTLGTATPVNNLAIDASGNIVSGTTTGMVETTLFNTYTGDTETALGIGVVGADYIPTMNGTGSQYIQSALRSDGNTIGLDIAPNANVAFRMNSPRYDLAEWYSTYTGSNNSRGLAVMLTNASTGSKTIGYFNGTRNTSTAPTKDLTGLHVITNGGRHNTGLDIDITGGGYNILGNAKAISAFIDTNSSHGISGTAHGLELDFEIGNTGNSPSAIYGTDITIDYAIIGDTLPLAYGHKSTFKSRGLSSNTTITDSYGFHSSVVDTGYANTMTNYYGVYLADPTGLATLTVTNPYGIYQEGSNVKNYFGGQLQLNTIGSATPVTNLGVDASGNVVSGTTGGNVSNTATPLNDQLAVWTDATTIEGNSQLIYQSNQLQVKDGTGGFSDIYNYGRLIMGNASHEIDIHARYGNVNHSAILVPSGSSLFFGVENQPSMYFDSGGNVSIGQNKGVGTTHSARLEITGEGNDSSKSSLIIRDINGIYTSTIFEVKNDGTVVIPNVGTGTSVTNLGVDASGNVVSGTTGGGGSSLWSENSGDGIYFNTAGDSVAIGDTATNGLSEGGKLYIKGDSALTHALKVDASNDAEAFSVESASTRKTWMYHMEVAGTPGTPNVDIDSSAFMKIRGGRLYMYTDTAGSVNGFRAINQSGHMTLDLYSNLGTKIWQMGSNTGYPNFDNTAQDFTFGTTTSLGARVGIRGTGTGSGTSSLITQDSGGNTTFEVKDDGTINIPNVGTGTSVTNLGVDASGNVVSGTTGGGGGGGLNYISAGTVATNLETTSNWDINGVYTGTTATGAQADCHVDSNYWFTCVATDTWIRLIRG